LHGGLLEEGAAAEGFLKFAYREHGEVRMKIERT
jgi:hypothetical protein